MKEEWYSPGQISNRYSKRQVIWLLKNVMDSEAWPPECRETGYTGDIKKHHSGRAPFETTMMVISELKARLQQCGDDGLALEFTVRLADGYDVWIIQRLAHYQRRDFHQVQEGIDMALCFCCGTRRRRYSYKRYCFLYRQRNARQAAETRQAVAV